jgi:hypothetical protein
MRKVQKKSRERFWVERLRNLSGLAFEIDDARDEQERPDFLVRYKGRTVGIEVSELQIDKTRPCNHGSSLQKETSLRRQVVSRAYQIYFSNSLRPINAKVYFQSGPGQSLQTINRRQLAWSISDALCQLRLDPSERRRLDPHSKPSVPRPVGFVKACGIPGNITPHWQVISPGWPKELKPADVETILREKNALIQEYRKIVAENWLLIVADGTVPPGMFRPPQGDTPKLPASEFSRTFFICEPDRIFIEWP